MHLGGVPDPQLEVQFRQESLEPARMSTGFHAHTHLRSLGRQLTLELLRFLTVLQSTLPAIPSFTIDKCNLLEARMIITPYNNHVGSFLPGLGWVAPPKSIRAWEPTLLWNHLHSNEDLPCSTSPLNGSFVGYTRWVSEDVVLGGRFAAETQAHLPN